MEQLAVVVPMVQVLDIPVPQMVEHFRYWKSFGGWKEEAAEAMDQAPLLLGEEEEEEKEEEEEASSYLFTFLWPRSLSTAAVACSFCWFCW